MTDINSPSTPAAASQLSPLKRAFLALEDAEERLSKAQAEMRAPIAVIGMGCRLPGAENAAEFWQMLCDGRDAVRSVPRERFNIDDYFDPDPTVPGKIAVREAGFIGAIDQFDSGFFGIAPREADGMDPQQRLLLEVGWEALENAGQAPDRLTNSSTGVYLGLCSADYSYLQLRERDKSLLDAHYASGVAHSVAAGRISYLLGLQGPSLSIDTACSSSLVAVHLACQALRSGDCRMALAGGANLLLSPDLFVAFSHSRMLAPDGRCKAFDAAANGFGRGEGAGVVVLKRLVDAQSDGDRVLAVLRASAVNQDGPSSSLTAPNGPAQEAVIRRALDMAGVNPADIGYVECHGTGTQLGDPLEVRALGNVFGPGRDPARPLQIASVKTNIGHIEAAAGVAGLIKVILALQHRKLPPHLHFKAPSPHIPWGDLPFSVPTSLTSWDAIAGRRIAGVSAFGFSGTNAHIIIEEAPASAETPAPDAGLRPNIYTLSARDEPTLGLLASHHAIAIDNHREASLASLCFTANAGRADFKQRAAIVASNPNEIATQLKALGRGVTDGVRTASVVRRDPPRIAFLFTGQGAQYFGMAQGLYDTEPVFRDTLDACANGLSPYLDLSLFDILFTGDPASNFIHQTQYAQPALFSIEYALAKLWQSWGIKPTIVLGHSVGEVVAACVAGLFSLEDALKLIAGRGRLMGSLPSGGAMAAVHSSSDVVLATIKERFSAVAIAAVNAPDQCVISGVADEVDLLCKLLAERGIRFQQLQVSHAFHSPLLEPILDDFEQICQSIRWRQPSIRLISNVTGSIAPSQMLQDPHYWRRQVRQPVQFAQAARDLAKLRPDICIEIGPSPALLPFVRTAFGNIAAAFVPSLRKGHADRAQILNALATCYLEGAAIDWHAVHGGEPHEVVDLPTYPFQRERRWFHTKRENELPTSRSVATGHALLGSKLRLAGADTVYEGRMSGNQPAFVSQHQIFDQIVVPGTCYFEILLAAGRELLGPAGTVDEVILHEAMRLTGEPSDQRAVQCVVGPARDGKATAMIFSMADDEVEWKRHVSAILSTSPPPKGQSPVSLAEARLLCTHPMAASAFYDGFERRGLRFGPIFNSAKQLWRGDGRALGRVELDAALWSECDSYRMHPVLLDGCLQLVGTALADQGGDDLYLPFSLGSYRLHREGRRACWAYAKVKLGQGGETVKADVWVYDDDGGVVAELANIQLKRIAWDSFSASQNQIQSWFYGITWKPAPQNFEDNEVPQVLRIATAAVADGVFASIDHYAKVAGLETFDACHAKLETLCIEYIAHAFAELGWPPEGLDGASLRSRLQVVDRHRKLFDRFLVSLVDAGWLVRNGERWVPLRPFQEANPEQTFNQLVATESSIAAELEFVTRPGSGLAQALRGKADPLQLLFPNGSIASAERLYRDSPASLFFGKLASEAVVKAVGNNKLNQKPLRILEIGAGTGGTTAHVVPRLSYENIQYTFTDVGRTFVEQARERFGNHPFMRFALLDLERDPEQQGFTAGDFDLIIAANVVHATQDLRQTLNKVRRLLAPEGMLLLIEVTAPQVLFDVTVGLTEGWWGFQDFDLRPDYSLLGPPAWKKLLGQTGFDDIITIGGDENYAGALSRNAIILARAAASRQDDDAQLGRNWLILADASGVARRLSDRLVASGDYCALLPPGQPLTMEWLGKGQALHGVIEARALDLSVPGSLPTVDSGRAAIDSAAQAMRAAQALLGLTPVPKLWILTRGAQAIGLENGLSTAASPVWGLGKALRLEHPELRAICIDLDPSGDESEEARIISELKNPGDDGEVALRRGSRYVSRLTRLASVTDRQAEPDEHWRLDPAVPGSLEQFRCSPVEQARLNDNEVEIAVEAAALNFKDVLNVLGLYPGSAGPLGGECAGTISRVGENVRDLRVGDAVMAVASGSLASHVVAASHFVQRRPDGMSAEEGASISIAYLTAEYCLGHLANLRTGQRVLIHAAAGGVGMAAIKLAKRAGVEIFATAGSPWKRDLVRSMGASQVFDSRNTDFAQQIMAATEGKGVDVVLNSLAGDLIEPSFNVLAKGGCFVEIGKRGIKSQQWVDAQRRGIRYFVVDWGETAQQEPQLIASMYSRIVEDIKASELTPLPRHVFALRDAERAFKLMAQARHAGKVILRLDRPRPWVPRKDGTYLVTGGLSGLGLCVAQWLAESGAGRLVLIGRRGMTPEAGPVIDALRHSGTMVDVERLDVCDEAGLHSLLSRLRAEGPPLRGVWHSAGVLADAMLSQQDEQRFNKVLGPKVIGSALLDVLTRQDPLDCFVMFASAASVLGSRGQTNHAAANAYLDLLAHQRAARGLPALSINWGPWSTIGSAADQEITERLAGQGLQAVSPQQGLSAMQALLQLDPVQAAVLPIDWTKYLSHEGSQTLLTFLSDVTQYVRSSPTQQDVGRTAVAAEHFLEELAGQPAARRRPMLVAFVRKHALRILGIDQNRSVDPRMPLSELGLDSLLSVELRNALGSAIGQQLPVSLLFDFPTLEGLTDHLFELLQSGNEDGPEASPEQKSTVNLVGSIEELSDEEVDRLLARRAQTGRLSEDV